MRRKLPAFQFYPGDWLKDPRLRVCTHAAKGVYMDMLCLMFECDERGILATSGRPWSDEEIARAVGGDWHVTFSCIQELVEKGVVSRSETGALYSRRMVRDEHKRRLCGEAGKKGGGNPSLTYKGLPKGRPKGDSKGHVGSSSSVSSSPSGMKVGRSVGGSLEGVQGEDSPEAEVECLGRVESQHIRQTGSLCAIHRAANAESPEKFPADEETLLAIITAAVRSRREGGLSRFRGIVRKQRWDVRTGDERRQARELLAQHRQQLREARESGQPINPQHIPLCDEEP